MNLSKREVWVWILCLACLAVGARNFEPGLSIDGPLYATISRNMARGLGWLEMKGGVPDFVPYTDHPHLGFWIQALIFKVLPAADWSARISSHLFYVLFMGLFFFSVRKLSGQLPAVVAVLALWIWSPFSNYFSNFYLDPGMLLSGAFFLFALWQSLNRLSWGWALMSGLSLAACAMIKGLSVLMFGPCAALLCFYFWQQSFFQRQDASALKVQVALVAMTLMSAFVVLGGYALCNFYGPVPDFFSRYWTKQMTNRFSGSFSLMGIFNQHFWQQLTRDTYGLLGLALLSVVLALFKRHRGRLLVLSPGFIFPLVLFLTSVFMYAPTERAGGQYWIAVMPWVAWLLGNLVSEFDNGVLSRKIILLTQTLAIAGVFVVQYLPIKTHHRNPPLEAPLLLELSSKAKIKKLYFEMAGMEPDFSSASPLAWYGDMDLQYVNPNRATPYPSEDWAYLLRGVSAARTEVIRSRGWCLYWNFDNSSLWVSCDGQG